MGYDRVAEHFFMLPWQRASFSTNVEENMAGTSSDFGGRVVPFSFLCDCVEKEPCVKCAEKQGGAVILHSHNFGIVGQFVPQIATWNVKKGGKC